jgi:3-hydroxybutyryl-CoA dehydrogenase
VSEIDAPLPGRAAVVGGGTMGAGIAAAFALAGVATTVVLRRESALAEASEAVAQRLDAQVRLGLASTGQAADARDLVSTRVGGGGGPYDVVLESVAEELEAKRAVLAQAEGELGEGGVLCSNTSSLAIGELARAVADPGRLAGWHWFHPADLVELVEIIPGPKTQPATLDRLAGWSRALRKQPVVLSREIEGFVANRLQYALLREAYAIVAEGVCSPADVDAAVTSGLGARWAAIGPFASMDLAGLDVHAAVARALFPKLSRATELPELLRETIEKGGLGAAQGMGLRGRYTADEAASVVEARDETLAARVRMRRA